MREKESDWVRNERTQPNNLPTDNMLSQIKTPPLVATFAMSFSLFLKKVALKNSENDRIT